MQIEENKVTIEKKLKWKVSIIAASIVIGMILVTFIMGENKTENIGNINDPDVAYLETVKALELVSKELNKSISQAKYLNEYEKTKQIIFK